MISGGKYWTYIIWRGEKHIDGKLQQREIETCFWDKKTFGPTVTSSVLMVDGIIVTVSGSGLKQRWMPWQVSDD